MLKSAFYIASIVENNDVTTFAFREYYRQLSEDKELSFEEISTLFNLLRPLYLNGKVLTNEKLKSQVRQILVAECQGVTKKEPLLRSLNYLLSKNVLTEERWEFFKKNPQYRRVVKLLAMSHTLKDLHRFSSFRYEERACKNINALLLLYDTLKAEQKSRSECRNYLYNFLQKDGFCIRNITLAFNTMQMYQFPMGEVLNFFAEADSKVLSRFCDVLDYVHNAKMLTWPLLQKMMDKSGYVPQVILHCDMAYFTEENLEKLLQSTTAPLLDKGYMLDSLKQVMPLVLEDDARAYQTSLALMQVRSFFYTRPSLYSGTIRSFSSAGLILQKQGLNHWVNELLLANKADSIILAELVIELDLADLLSKENIQRFIDSKGNAALVYLMKVLRFHSAMTSKYYESLLSADYALCVNLVMHMHDNKKFLQLLESIPINKREKLGLGRTIFNQRRSKFLQPSLPAQSQLLNASFDNYMFDDALQELEINSPKLKHEVVAKRTAYESLSPLTKILLDECLKIMAKADIPAREKLRLSDLNLEANIQSIYHTLILLDTQELPLLSGEIVDSIYKNTQKIVKITRVLSSLDNEQKQKDFLSIKNITYLLNHPKYDILIKILESLVLFPNKIIIFNLIFTHEDIVGLWQDILSFRTTPLFREPTSAVAWYTPLGQLLDEHGLYDNETIHSLLPINDYYGLERSLTMLAAANPCLLDRYNLRLIIHQGSQLQNLLFLMDCLVQHNLLNQENFVKIVTSEVSMLRNLRFLDLIYAKKFNQKSFDKVIQQSDPELKQALKKDFAATDAHFQKQTRISSQENTSSQQLTDCKPTFFQGNNEGMAFQVIGFKIQNKNVMLPGFHN